MSENRSGSSHGRGRRVAGRAQDDHRIDPYQSSTKPVEGTVCPDCGAAFHAGRWQWASSSPTSTKPCVPCLPADPRRLSGWRRRARGRLADADDAQIEAEIRAGEPWLNKLQNAVSACGSFALLVGQDGV